jgi:hypothetical protein
MASPNNSWKSRIYVVLVGIALGLLALAIKGKDSVPIEQPVPSPSLIQP